MSRELKIGEIGVIDGVKVQCVAGGGCLNCAFHVSPTIFNCGFIFQNCELDDLDEEAQVPCVKEFRSDHTDVYFKKIE